MDWLTESQEYVNKLLLKENAGDIVKEWVSGNLNSIRNSNPQEVYDEINKAQKWSRLYRYIDNLPLQKSLNKKYNFDIDPIYSADIGDVLEYNLISTTLSSPSKAWDEWFDTTSNVLLIKGARGIDVQDYGGTKFKWEREILTYGKFKLVDITEISDPKRTDYTLYTLQYID